MRLCDDDDDDDDESPGRRVVRRANMRIDIRLPSRHANEIKGRASMFIIQLAVE